MELATMQVYAKLNGTWTEITQYVMEANTLTVKRGFSSNDETDRLADTGTCYFYVNNSTGLFDPELATVLAGWEIATKIGVRFTFENKQWTKFYGAVSSMTPADEVKVGVGFIKVVCLDYLRYFYQYPLKTPTIQVDQTSDVAVSTIINNLDEAPLNTDYDTGINEFEALFDTVKDTTKAATELNKVVLSELGYLYEICDPVYGQTLRYENAHARSGLKTLSKRSQDAATAGYVKNSSGGYVFNSSGGKIISGIAEDCDIDGSNFKIDTGLEYARGDGQIINRIKVTASPKDSDASPVVLYKTATRIKLAPGKTYTYDGKYTDPNGGKDITVYDDLMIDPVATTDYTMNRNSAGTGTDITADLTITVVFGADKPTITLTNGSVYTGYIALQLRGQGIYAYDTISAVVEDATSQQTYGVQEMTINQPYQQDIIEGSQFAEKTLLINKDPRRKYNKIYMNANRSGKNMYSFLCIEIGDLVHISDSSKNLDSWFYVQGIGFTVSSGTIIDFYWIIQEAFSEAAGNLTPVEFELIKNTYYPHPKIDFGNINELTMPNEITIICDIYSELFLAGTGPKVILGKYAGGNIVDSGWRLAIEGTRIFGIRNYVQDHSIWMLCGGLTDGAWNRVAISSTNFNDYLLASGSGYVNGSYNALSISDHAAGAENDISNSFTIGKPGLVGSIINFGMFSGKVKGIKIYNVALTADEIALDYAGTLVTRGLVFQAPYILTKDTAHYTDLTLTSTDKLIDNVYGIVGTPSGSPICRIP